MGLPEVHALLIDIIVGTWEDLGSSPQLFQGSTVELWCWVTTGISSGSEPIKQLDESEFFHFLLGK